MKPDGDRTCRHAHVAEEIRVKKRDMFTACASGVCVIYEESSKKRLLAIISLVVA